MWTKITTSKWFYRLISLAFALLLFTYVNFNSLSFLNNSDNQYRQSVSATRKETIKVPLRLDADTDKYYITGYPEKVSVDLEGPSSLVTTTVNTQNFEVIASLRHLGLGKHTVTLKATGLNKELTYAISPKTITVDIQNRKTQKFPIQVTYNKNAIAEGYVTEQPKLSQDTVQVTGATDEIRKIARVVANVPLSRNTKATANQEVLLQALDSNGNIVNAVLDPQTIHVTLGIRLPSKTVPLSFTTEKGKDNLDYTVSSSVKTVKITATSDVLNKIKSLTVPVDVSNIATAGSFDQQISIPLKDNDLDAADPSSVKITVKASNTSSGASDSESAASAQRRSVVSSSSSSTSSSKSSSDSSSSSSND